MTKKEFSDALTELVATNDINVSDAIHVLIAEAAVIALSISPPEEARKRLLAFTDDVFNDAVAALKASASS